VGEFFELVPLTRLTFNALAIRNKVSRGGLEIALSYSMSLGIDAGFAGELPPGTNPNELPPKAKCNLCRDQIKNLSDIVLLS
jgi:hypothetical protein